MTTTDGGEPHPQATRHAAGSAAASKPLGGPLERPSSLTITVAGNHTRPRAPAATAAEQSPPTGGPARKP